MRKILLATTALVGFAVAGAAQAAAPSPINVVVGGDVDFVAGQSAGGNHGNGANSSNRSFESLYDLVFNITGKANNGVEYGGVLDLTNAPSITNFYAGTQTPYMSAANIWMSGAFGKVVLGDQHGATDLAVVAPSVGEGQTTGRYIDFLDTHTFAKNLVVGVDGGDVSTAVSYYTPKVGNDSNKVQLGVSYVPQFYNYSSTEVHYDSGTVNANANSPYHDVFKGVLNYTGTIAPVALKADAHFLTGSANTVGGTTNWLAGAPGTTVQDFTAWGLGLSGALNGFTAGATYADDGSYNTVAGQTKDQHRFGAGVKYEFDKYGVAFNYTGGEGYSNILNAAAAGGAGSSTNYIKDFNTYGVGGTYAWAPGLTTGVDGVFYDQKSDASIDNHGYVLLVSQKLAF
jgi:hypothetical protein